MSFTKQRGENRNPKHIYYVSLLNSQQWQGVNGLRARTLRKYPFCQICREEGIKAGVLPDGYVRSSRDVHHLRPVEDVGRYYQPGEEVPEEVKAAMRERCFDEKNVIAVCRECHIRLHRQMQSHVGQQAQTMPKEVTDGATITANFITRITGQEVRPEQVAPVRKGIRKTRFGWVTPEEFKEKIEQQQKDWKSNLLNRFTHDDSGTEDAPTVDAPAKD